MEVTLKLVGIVQEYYPEAGSSGSAPVKHEVAAGTSVRALLDALGIPHEPDYFIMIDDELVEADAASTRALADGDAVTLVPVIKGG